MLKTVAALTVVTSLIASVSLSNIAAQTSGQGEIIWRDGAGQVEESSLSPDGHFLSYVDPTTRELSVRDVQAGRSWKLTAIAAAGGEVGTSVVSFDSQLIAFSSRVSGEGWAIRVLPLRAEGAVSGKTIHKGESEPREWSKDGGRLLVTTSSRFAHEIGIVTVAAGTLKPLKSMPGWSPLPVMALSPDGSLVAFDTRLNKPNRHRSVFVMPTTGGPEVSVLDEGDWSSVLGWSPDGGDVVVFSDRGGSRGLWAIPIREGRRAGEPRLIAKDFTGIPKSVTSSGDIFYIQPTGAPAAQLYLTSIDSDGHATGRERRYTPRDNLALNRLPRWSADGHSFLYLTSRLPGPWLSIVPADGTVGKVRELPLHLSQVVTFDWSRDGQLLVFRGIDLDGRFGILVVEIATEKVRRVVTGAPAYHPQFTPDSQSVTYFKFVGPNEQTWSYVERNLATDAERVIHAELPKLKPATDRNRYPAGRSPDGRYLLAQNFGQGASLLLAYDTKTDTVRELLRVEQRDAFNHNGGLSYTSDSRAVIATVRNPANAQDIWWIPLDGRKPHKIDITVADIAENTIAIHPNGRQIAFAAGRPLSQTMRMLPAPAYIGQPADFRLLRRVVSGPVR